MQCSLVLSVLSALCVCSLCSLCTVQVAFLVLCFAGFVALTAAGSLFRCGSASYWALYW